MWEELPGLGEQLAPRAIGKPLVGQDQGHPIACLLQSGQLVQRRGGRPGGQDLVRPAVTVIQLAAQELDGVRVVVDGQDDGKSLGRDDRRREAEGATAHSDVTNS